MSTCKQLAALWATDFRYMTFVERCRVGWQLWRDNVQQWPLPATKTNPELWVTLAEICSDKHSYPKDEPDCRLCGCFGPCDDCDPCTRPVWVGHEFITGCMLKNSRWDMSSDG